MAARGPPGARANNARFAQFKLVLLGESAVGKSSLVLRFVKDQFDDYRESTIGAAFLTQTISLDEATTVKFEIWDTAGQERFKTITSSYYKGAHGIILVYDITDKQSFRDIDNWLSEVEKHANENVNKLLVGNKSDLEQNRQVSYEEGKAYADQLGIKFLETSAKNSVNVESSFFTMANEIKARVQPDNAGGVKKETTAKKLGGGEEVTKKSGGCC